MLEILISLEMYRQDCKSCAIIFFLTNKNNFVLQNELPCKCIKKRHRFNRFVFKLRKFSGKILHVDLQKNLTVSIKKFC